ncbi:MAG: hypothetical protein QXN63_03665 [Candidatus Bathyarchaeia archaeon]
MDTEEVIERATDFLQKKAGYYSFKLLSVRFDEARKVWDLRFDVGLFVERIVSLTIDDASGRVTSYESPK